MDSSAFQKLLLKISECREIMASHLLTTKKVYNKAALNETSVSNRKENIAMRTKDSELLNDIKMFVNDYCDNNGYTASGDKIIIVNAFQPKSNLLGSLSADF